MFRKKTISIVIGALIFSFILFSFIRSHRIIRVERQTGAVIQSDQKSPPVSTVIRVIDGDTIEVNVKGVVERVRLIGVDTPEIVGSRKSVQCFAAEASDFLKSMLPGGTIVTLESDISQDNRDKYGRLLRYVYRGDVLVDEEIIQEGYGFEYTYNVPYEFQKEFKQSEEYARSGGLGLWSACRGGN